MRGFGMAPCIELVHHWWQWHPPVGTFIAVLAIFGVFVPLYRPWEKIGRREKAIWTIVMFALLWLELRTLYLDRDDHDAEQVYVRCAELQSFQKIADGIKQELDNTSQILEIERQGRSPHLSPEEERNLIKKWGQVSRLQTKAVEGAVATSEHPSQIQQGRRTINAEALGAALKSEPTAAATVINDGTNEAGNFANQLVIGLGFGGWQAGGDNIKMGDPAFFPDSLTVEVSSNPASPGDRSSEAAKALVAALKRQGVEVSLRYTTLAFPPNFMRIKVAGQ